MYLLMLRVLLG